MSEASSQAAKPSGSEIATLSFEAALAELEGIVKSLETGQGSLAEAIESYERGVALRQRCEMLLAEAEAKVQAIVSAPGGSPSGGPTLRDVE
jgi:exodeoxyribonuclease VII small subunit